MGLEARAQLALAVHLAACRQRALAVPDVRHLALDVLQKLLLVLDEVGVVELQVLLLTPQTAVVNAVDLAESVHVELANEARHVVVLEEARQDLARKPRLVEDVEAEAGGVPGDQLAVLFVFDESP